jgi:prepilin-type processing-associated H-X9-DG protein
MKKQAKASSRNRKRTATKDLTPRQVVSGKAAHSSGANFAFGDGSVRMGDGSVRLLNTSVSN